MERDEDAFPNFGNACPPTTTTADEAASWHPARRQNSEMPAEEDDDFFDRYPGATPKKQQAHNAEMPAQSNSPIRRTSISVQQTVEVKKETASTEELESLPSTHVEVEGPISEHIHDEVEDEDALPVHDEDAAVLEPDEAASEQEDALEELMPDVPSENATQDIDDSIDQADYAAVDEAEEQIQSPSEHYEHQGEVTEMEEAIEPSAEAPLMDDEEPLPISEVASRQASMSMPSRESTIGFDGAPAPRQPRVKSEFAKPQIDRSFTTNFSDSPVEAPRQQAQTQDSIPEEWPSIGDDQTFGELLDNQNAAQTQRDELEAPAAPSLGDDQTFGELLDDHQVLRTQREQLEEAAAQESIQEAAPDDDLLPEDVGEVKEEDLAAAWGAAVDDDELLEETPTSFDPSQAFGGDDDGFLEEEPPAPARVQSQPGQPQQQRSAPAAQYRPPNPQQPQYGMPSPHMFDSVVHGRSAGTPSTGLFDIYNQPGSVQQQPPQSVQRPGMPPQAQSFVDKAKGGYQSPYDLPMDVVKPKRRPQQSQSQQQAPAPPPRTSSFGSQMGAQMASRTNTFASQAGQAPPPRPVTASSLSPPQSSHSGGSTAPHPGTMPVKTTPKTGSGFFEDLPISTKPRARPAVAYTPQPQQGMPTPPLNAGPMPPPQQHPLRGPPTPQIHQVPQERAAPSSIMQPANPGYGGIGGLRQPERMPLLPDQPIQYPPQPQPHAQVSHQNQRYSPNSQRGGSMAAPPPPTHTRYSPAPTSTAVPQAPAASRYSPAPAAQPAQRQALNRFPSATGGPPPGVANPFAPRTSSPLAAQVDKPHPPLPLDASRALPPNASRDLPSDAGRGLPTASPPKTNGLPRTTSMSSKYAPSEAPPVVPAPTSFGPPLQRPKTQSPDATMKGPKMMRPSSAAGVTVPAPQPAMQPRGPVLPHRRQFSRELTFAAPQDERAQDPLERWKGGPIFKWSASGTVVSSFPKQTPFYSTGQGIPSVKCTPGAITMQDASHFLPMDDRNAKFPGPLKARSKGQKKDVLAWLAGKIEDLQRQAESAMLDFSMDAEMRKRVEEKLVLWKIVRIFIDNDGALEGIPKIEDEIRMTLLPNLEQMAQVAGLQSPVSASAGLQTEGVDKQVTFQLRQALLEGHRERAVWLAEEKKLWGHAMLIASTMGPEVWKQIVQAFVRSQVKSVGSDARSMAALYQVFAGNSEECVDELVPPSARAGFRMISNVDGTVSGSGLEGLDQWRETLGLVASNRTPSDGQSLLALGKLLAKYGRVEAAHTCYLFARQFVKHSGADDAEATFVLLGANHEVFDEGFGNDLDSILLTEIYEYAASLSAPSTAVPYIPHLQAFKLMHAQTLAAYGLKTKAATYADHIASAYQSTTRPSGYYHPIFTQSVADFSAYLSQSPHDGKAGFWTKPAMNKVSSGAASWFSKFVAGEDDAQSTGSGPGGAGSDDMAGPFGRVNGGTPSLSRSASSADLYSPTMGGGSGMPIPGMSPGLVGTPSGFAPSSAPSRYAPTSLARAQTYGSGMPAAEPQRPSSSRYAPAPSANLGVPRPDVARRGSDHSVGYAPSSRRGSGHETSSQGSYEPRPILADDVSAYSYSPPVHSPPVHSPAARSPLVQPQVAPAVQEPEEMDAFAAPNGVSEQVLHAEHGGFDPETGSGYESLSGGYDPPSYSYQPYEPEPDSPEETKAKKTTFGDEDDNFVPEQRAATQKKSQADREADDAFKKAAEADAARDKGLGGDKKGWFGGWFGGKRDPNAAPGPIKAKLGEENSFYYDENLKKWVNKKGGSEATTPAAATPPPPRGSSGRVASATSMGPPSGPPSRVASGTDMPGRPPTSISGPAFSGPPSGPPSRIATPASQPSSEPGHAPPAGLNGDAPLPLPAAPPLRPGSSLSTASSIDDLLAGPPGARKGGTVKGKKKGGRYIDVMAK